MAQATFSVRMDENLKREFDALCIDFGMNTSTAFNIFARAVVREKKIPFEITATNKETTLEQGKNAFLQLRQQAAINGLSELTLEQINDEINQARRESENT